MEKGGRRFIIDLHTQMVREEAVSSDSEGKGKNDDEGKKGWNQMMKGCSD